MKKIKQIQKTKKILKAVGVSLKADKINKSSPTNHIPWIEETALAEGLINSF